ncbi:MAG: hypothetical protein ACI8QS_002680 [Planctomycetota bacterium]
MPKPWWPKLVTTRSYLSAQCECLLKKGSNRRPACPNERCGLHAQQDQGNVMLHGFSKVKWGRPMPVSL